MKKFLLLLVIISSVFSSCKKDEPVKYDATPQITFESISPGTVKEFQDSITIVISYTDGDGDLGENNTDSTNLFVTDERINITYPFRIPQLGPGDSQITIKGKLNVVLKNTGITDGSNQQTASYKVFLRDRQYHTSNTVTTTSITVIK